MSTAPGLGDGFDDPWANIECPSGASAGTEGHPDARNERASEDALDIDVTRLAGLPIRLTNWMARNDLRTLREVKAIGDENLLLMRGFGVGMLDQLHRIGMSSLRLVPAGPGDDATGAIAAQSIVITLNVPDGMRDTLLDLGIHTMGDLGTLAPEDLESVHGIGRPGRLAVEGYLSGRFPRWPDTITTTKPKLAPRFARRVELVDVGLTPEALAELAEHRCTTVRDVSTWGQKTLGNLVSVQTLAEVQAALAWFGLEFTDTTQVSTFVEGVRHATDHLAEHGYIPVARVEYHGFRLGQWVMMQRQQYNSGNLDPSRAHALESLPTWAWSSKGIPAARVVAILEAGRAYVAEHGHIDVGSDDVTLRASLRTVRAGFDDLAEPWRAAFEALPGWLWDDAEAIQAVRHRHGDRRDTQEPNSQWRENYDELFAVAEESGGLNFVNLVEVERGKRLAHWASSQRGRQEKLTLRQRDLLQAIPGWSWSGIKDRDMRRWRSAYDRLAHHVAGGGSPVLTATARIDGFGLGDWVRRQHRGREGLNEAQVTLLEAIPGWAWREVNEARSRVIRATPQTALRRELKWEAARRLTVDFYEANHVWPPAGFKTESGFDLGLWCISQRSMRSRGVLAPRREAALNATAGWRWNGQAQRGHSGPNLRRVCEALGIEPGAVLDSRSGMYPVEGILDEEYRIDVGDSAYETPTRAWLKATKSRSATSGWDAWRIEFDGAMQPLRDLRERVAEMDR